MAIDLNKYKLPATGAPSAPAPAGSLDLSKYRAAPAAAPAPAEPSLLSKAVGGATKFAGGLAKKFLGIPDVPADVAIGGAKGAAETLQNVGNVVAKPLNALLNKMTGQKQTVGLTEEQLTPTNTGQKFGKAAERIGEFLAPMGAVSKVQKGVDLAIAGKGILPAAGRVLTKAGAEGAAAGGVTLAQTADPTEAVWSALGAGVLKAGTGTLGEALRGAQVPEWLYSKVFKTSYDDMERELKTTGAAALQKKDPALYKTLVERGIIKTGADGAVALDPTLARTALEKGLKGGLHNMANVTVTNLYKNELAVQDIAKAAKETIDVSETQFQSVFRQIGQQYQDVGFGDFSTKALELADAIKANKGQLSVDLALKARRLLDGLRASSSFGETPPTLSLGQKNLKFLANQLRTRLAKIPGMGEVMKDYSFNIDALEALSKEAARRGNNQVISLIDSVLLGGGVASANPATGGALYVLRKGLNQPALVTRVAQGINNSGNITPKGALGKAALFSGMSAVQEQLK